MKKKLKKFSNLQNYSAIDILTVIYVLFLPLQFKFNSNIIFLEKFRLTDLTFIIIIFFFLANYKKYFFFNDLINYDFLIPFLLILSCFISFTSIGILSENIFIALLSFLYLFSLYIIISKVIQQITINLLVNAFILTATISSIAGIFGLVIFYFLNLETSLIEIREEFPYFINIIRVQSFTNHPNFFSSLLAIPILIIMSQILQFNKSNFIRMCILFILLTAFILTFSKDIIILIVSMLVIFLILKKNKINSFFKIMLILIIIILIFSHNLITNIYFSFNSSLNNETVYFSYNPCCVIKLFDFNLYLYPTNYLFNKLAALEILISSNYLGIGLENYQYVISKVDVSFFKSFWSWKSIEIDPHSTYFGSMAELGLFGFFSVLLLLFYFLYKSYKLVKQNDKNYLNTALFSIIFYYIFVAINLDILTFRHLWIVFAIIVINQKYQKT